MHKLPKLKYGYGALAPFIDARTMKIHHSKHHQGYVDKLNAALESQKGLKKKSVEELIRNLNKLPASVRGAVRNNGGGHYNHSLFWEILKKGKTPKGKINYAIEKKFGSFDKFKEAFSKAGATQFGSGWAWLVVDKRRRLKVVSTANQDSPLTNGEKPILGMDVWEHAYYLKYQNKRPAYIEAFFKVINWDKVNENFIKALKR